MRLIHFVSKLQPVRLSCFSQSLRTASNDVWALVLEAKDDLLRAKDEVVIAKEETNVAYKILADVRCDLAVADVTMKNIQNNLLELQSRRNVRGAVEHLVSNGRLAAYPVKQSHQSKGVQGRLDAALAAIPSMREDLERLAIKNQVAKDAVFRSYGHIYHILSKSFHGNDGTTGVAIRVGDIESVADVITLCVIFKTGRIKYEVVDRDGKFYSVPSYSYARCSLESRVDARGL